MTIGLFLRIRLSLLLNFKQKQLGDNPILIRIETDGGHGGGTTTDQWIEEVADEYSFAFYNMGVQPIY